MGLNRNLGLWVSHYDGAGSLSPRPLSFTSLGPRFLHWAALSRAAAPQCHLPADDRTQSSQYEPKRPLLSCQQQFRYSPDSDGRSAMDLSD